MCPRAARSCAAGSWRRCRTSLARATVVTARVCFQVKFGEYLAGTLIGFAPGSLGFVLSGKLGRELVDVSSGAADAGAGGMSDLHVSPRPHGPTDGPASLQPGGRAAVAGSRAGHVILGDFVTKLSSRSFPSAPAAGSLVRLRAGARGAAGDSAGGGGRGCERNRRGHPTPAPARPPTRLP
jgi:hypothetical protein